MSNLTPWSIFAMAMTFVLAGLVKGVTGMGLPTVAMGLLGALLSPVAAAALLIVPSFVTNLWQFLAGPALGSTIVRLWPMMLAVAAGTLASARLLTGGDASVASGLLGLALIIYAGCTLLGRQLAVPRAVERWLAPLVGAATGVVTGATGVFVIPAVPFLQALDLSRDELVQALGLSFTVSTVALAAGLAWNGAFHPGNIVMSGLAVIPALGGMWAGQVVRRRVSAQTFRRWFLICLVLLGCNLVLGPFL